MNGKRGVNIVCYANQMLRSAYPAMLKQQNLYSNTKDLESTDKCISLDHILNLIPELSNDITKRLL